MRMIGTQDVFGTSGELAELLVKYGCDDNAIVAAAKELLAEGHPRLYSLCAQSWPHAAAWGHFYARQSRIWRASVPM